MESRPKQSEAAPYYFTYIDRVKTPNVTDLLYAQIGTHLPMLKMVTEQNSLGRYAPDKWSIRQVLNHVTDTERAFLFRAMWFARGLEGALPSFEQDTAALNAGANDVSWANHVEEFRLTRLATHMFFRDLPSPAWDRTGIASGKTFTVRAIAFIIAGHFDHHMAIVRERY